MQTVRRPGYGLYRGHEYRLRSRGRHDLCLYAVEAYGEIMTTWHADLQQAVAEFKAGVDDILDSDLDVREPARISPQ